MSQKNIEILVEAINDDPQKPFPHFALAKEYQKIDNTVLARKYYQHLIDQFPAYGGTYYHYALLLLEENDLTKAEKIIEQGLSVLHQSGETILYNELIGLRDTYFES